MKMTKKRLGTGVDMIMYVLMLTQMLYVFTTNNVHEVLGIAFFVCLIIHLILKRWWFKAAFRTDQNRSRLFFNIITMLLLPGCQGRTAENDQRMVGYGISDQ